MPGPFAQFDLDSGAPPYSRNYSLVTTNDTPEIILTVAGLVAGDVIEQVSFTAKVNVTDADNAPTTVQHIWQPPNGSTGPTVTPLDAAATSYQIVIPLTQNDTKILNGSKHGYDVRLWVQRGGVTFVRTVQQGQIIAYTGWTSQSVPVGGTLADENATLLSDEGYA